MNLLSYRQSRPSVVARAELEATLDAILNRHRRTVLTLAHSNPHPNLVRAYLAGHYDKEPAVTDSTDLTTYAGQVNRLDYDYIKAVGEALQARLFGGFSGGVPMESTLTARLVNNGLTDLETAQKIAELLQPPDGSNVQMPVAISYQPDNGTAYDLIFTPVRTMQQAGSEFGNMWSVPQTAFDGNGIPRPGWVVVAQVNGSYRFAEVFDLSFGHGHDASDISMMIGKNFADAAAICALFRAISGVDIV